MFGNNKKKKVKFTGVTEDGRKITGEIMPSLISGNMRADFIPANAPSRKKIIE